MKNGIPIKDEYSITEVATITGFSPSTILRWIKEEYLTAHRRGKKFWRINRSEVERIINIYPKEGN
jgi:excisionase family DNA binding protein